MIESYMNYPEDKLLCDDDFPSNYLHMAHPEDYTLQDNPVKSFIIHSKHGRHYRLLARVSWKVNGGYIPMTFVCDTGAPKHLYLSSTASDVLAEYGIIIQGETGLPEVEVFNRPSSKFRAAIEDTPKVHKDANIIGL